MKRLVGVLAAVLMGCGGATVRVELGAEQGVVQQELDATELAGAEKVVVTVTEVSAHYAGGGDDGSADAGQTADEAKASDRGWRVLSTKRQTVDLVEVRQMGPRQIAEVALPDGKVTQLRLKLDGSVENGEGRIPYAVTETDGTTCDLIVPSSAFNPGLKVSGVFKAQNDATVELSMSLKDSTRWDVGGCAYRLNPVIKVQRVR